MEKTTQFPTSSPGSSRRPLHVLLNVPSSCLSTALLFITLFITLKLIGLSPLWRQSFSADCDSKWVSVGFRREMKQVESYKSLSSLAMSFETGRVEGEEAGRSERCLAARKHSCVSSVLSPALIYPMVSLYWAFTGLVT